MSIGTGSPDRHRPRISFRGCFALILAGLIWLAAGWTLADSDTEPAPVAEQETENATEDAARDTRPAGRTSRVWVLEVDGAIGPASTDYITRNLRAAEAEGIDLFVMRLNTPGGLVDAMRDIISAILAADVPVATWVAPGGARAASAGTYILYASHIAAMAPATHLGAATPVGMGGPPGMPQDDEPADDEQDAEDTDENDEPARPPPADTAAERKAIEDSVAYIRGLAELRGRNADWAERAVREAVTLSARPALEANVIDLVARNIDELLDAVDGRTVTLERGEVRLAVADAEVTVIEPDWRSEFLGIITNPNIAYILLMIGIYGLILEFYNPGLGIPGITGVICLLLAFYALQMLPVSYVGVALIVIGIGLMITEAFAPSFGAFGVGGVVAFAFGSIMLMDTELPAYQISVPVIAAFVVASAGIFIFSISAAMRARQRSVVSGSEGMIGARAIAREDFEGQGHVVVMGEIWQARCDVPVRRGDRLRVRNVSGLVVDVEPDTGEPGRREPATD